MSVGAYLRRATLGHCDWIGKLSRLTRGNTLPVWAGAGTTRTGRYTPVWRPTPSARDSLAMVVWNIIPESILACYSQNPWFFVLYYEWLIGNIRSRNSSGVVFILRFVFSYIYEHYRGC